MKKAILLLSIICCVGYAGAQSCTPDLSITQPGMYPDTYTNLPNAYAGVPYSTSVQFKVITDTTISGTYVTVTNVTLDSISGMPPGFTWSSNPANRVFPGGSNACASMSGNPLLSQAGTYHLVVHLKVNGLAFGFIHVSQASTVTGYKIIINGPPVIYFSGTPTVTCEGDAVQFSDNTTGHPTSWQWDFPGGTPSSSSLQVPPAVLYAASGPKNVTLTVYNPAGSATKTKYSYVTVNSGPAAATITPTGNIVLCTGSTTTLSANTGIGLTYQWLKNGVNILGATASTYGASSTGNYSVKVSIASGCSKTSPATQVNVSNVSATVNASGSTTFCAGGNVALTANSGAGFNYQWKKDGTNISAATTISYNATAAGVYKVMITNSGGCTAISAGTTVTVNNLPPAAISANGAVMLCRGENVLLSANTGSGLTYQWTSVNIPINGAVSSSYVASTTGWYRAIVTNSSGCTNTSNLIHVYVNTLPIVTANANGPLSFCDGLNVKLTANSATGLTYQWMQHNTDISGATNISYFATHSGEFKVKVMDSNGCKNSSNKKTITVYNLPSATITASGPLTFCLGQNVILTANSGAGIIYQWTKHNINMVGETGISYLAKRTGAYKVVVSNIYGCSKTSTVKNVLVNCREENENEINSGETSAAIYPNPTSSATTIDLNLVKAGFVSIKVFDMTGKFIAAIADGNFEEGNHQFTFDVSPLANGIYFANINTPDGIKTIKLIVNKN